MAVGDAPYTDGPDVSALIAEMGMRLYEWQDLVLGDWCSRDGADRPSYVTCGLSVPRQNGKNAILEAFELYALTVSGWHILHTAHRVKTAKKSFQRLVKYFTDKRHPEVRALVSNIRYTNGEESIHLSNGASIEFSARSRAGARGFDDIQLVVFDEAQDLTDDQLSAIMYTISASSTGERMMVYTGTPPDGASPGTVFARMRESALSRPAKRSCWHEWSVESLPRKGCAFGDIVDEIYAANPSMGHTLDLDWTENEFNSADLVGFAVERLGWWPSRAGAKLIPREWWEGSAIDAGSVPSEGKKAFGVKFDPSGERAALAVCVLPESGRAHVELIAEMPRDEGLRWITGFLCDEDTEETTSAVAVDGRSGADALADELSATYPRQAVMRPGTAGVVAASVMFFEALRDGAVTHWRAPGGEQAALDESVLSAVKRNVGSDGGWAFGGEGSTAAEAAVIAYWAAKTTRRDAAGGCEVL